MRVGRSEICFAVSLFTVVATIAICLFPLWPSNIREYVWYLSVLAAAAVGSILVLAVCKLQNIIGCFHVMFMPCLNSA